MKKSRKYNIKKFAVILLVATFVCVNIIALTGCDNTQKETTFDNTYKPPVYNTSGEDKQAIIVLPGMFASNLVNAETNEPLWSGGGLMNNLFMTQFRVTKAEVSNYFKSFLYKDEQGNSVVPIRAATMYDKYLQYGLIDEYRNMYKFFNNKYNEGVTDESKKYEVVIYQYDWTKSAKESAEELNQFITANNYKNNILVGHNLGGIVCDYYLAQNEASRLNTKGFISLGTPHFGTMSSVFAFSDFNIDLSNENELFKIMDLLGIKINLGELNDFKNSVLDSIMGLKLVDKIPLEYIPENVDTSNLTAEQTLKIVLPFIQDVATDVISFVKTMPSLYDMLPSEEIYTGNVTINGEAKTYSEFIQAIKNTPNVKSNAQIATAIDNAINNRKSLYIGGKFVSNVFNKTYYIAGNGSPSTRTITGVNFTTKPNDSKMYLKLDTDNIKNLPSYTEFESYDSEGNKFINYTPKYVGDGLVTIDSATANNYENGVTKSNITVFALNQYYTNQDLQTPVAPSENMDMLPIIVPNELGKAINDAITKYILR